MSCEHPLLAVNLGRFDGKYKLKILPKRVDHNLLSLEEKYGHDNLMLLPCGCCPSCKASHQRQWAVRCTLESKYWRDNCMITLTYAPERRPKKLIKRDLQIFIKNMRNSGVKFRYFACGEYGSDPTKEHAPHFHIIMFGYWPSDAKFEYNSKSGFPLYSSKFVEGRWKNGIVTISEMAPGTAMYVAGYVDKKLGLDEFVLMSTRPGIGERYFREHLFDIYHYDNIVGAFGVASVPRYCDKIADYMWYDLDDIKVRRKKGSNFGLIQTMLDHGFTNKEDVFGYRHQLMKDRLMKRRRGSCS